MTLPSVGNNNLTLQPTSRARSNAGQWQPGQSGNPDGRPRGARTLLSERVLRALADDFREHGQAVVMRVRREDPRFYLQLCASLIPREFAVTKDEDPAESATREELAVMISILREALAEKARERATVAQSQAHGAEPKCLQLAGEERILEWKGKS